MRLSHDGQLLAAGDKAGNVHVYDVATLKLVAVQEAHDSEVLCLDFSPPPAQAAAEGGRSVSSSSSDRKQGRGLAASGSRDMLVHVYDAYNGFRLLETLDEHEAEVTAVRFTSGGRGLVSCGADHSIIFRCVAGDTCVASVCARMATRSELPCALLWHVCTNQVPAGMSYDEPGTCLSNKVTGTSQQAEHHIAACHHHHAYQSPSGVVDLCCHPFLAMCRCDACMQGPWQQLWPLQCLGLQGGFEGNPAAQLAARHGC